MDENDFKLKKSQIFLFFIICAGLYYITESFLMALGIMILLIIMNYSLSAWIVKRRNRDAEEDEIKES